MERGLVAVEEGRHAYQASVRSVWKALLPYLQQWVADGLTVVVTADHGETFGRFRDRLFYEYPCGCHIRPLVTVPWVQFEPTDRTETGDWLEDRLRALGYA
jgi:hypothetical protein